MQVSTGDSREFDGFAEGAKGAKGNEAVVKAKAARLPQGGLPPSRLSARWARTRGPLGNTAHQAVPQMWECVRSAAACPTAPRARPAAPRSTAPPPRVHHHRRRRRAGAAPARAVPLELRARPTTWAPGQVASSSDGGAGSATGGATGASASSSAAPVASAAYDTGEDEAEKMARMATRIQVRGCACARAWMEGCTHARANGDACPGTWVCAAPVAGAIYARALPLVLPLLFPTPRLLTTRGVGTVGTRMLNERPVRSHP